MIKIEEIEATRQVVTERYHAYMAALDAVAELVAATPSDGGSSAVGTSGESVLPCPAAAAKGTKGTAGTKGDARPEDGPTDKVLDLAKARAQDQLGGTPRPTAPGSSDPEGVRDLLRAAGANVPMRSGARPEGRGRAEGRKEHQRRDQGKINVALEVRLVVAEIDQPFTAAHVMTEVLKRHPTHHKFISNSGAVGVAVRYMHANGLIDCISKGTGKTPSTYRRAPGFLERVQQRRTAAEKLGGTPRPTEQLTGTVRPTGRAERGANPEGAEGRYREFRSTIKIPNAETAADNS